MQTCTSALHGLIFDLDGVICFTDGYHYLAWKRMADEEGIYFDQQINNRLRGVSRMQSLEIILEKSGKSYTQEEKQEMAERKNRYYRELLQKMTPADLAPETKKTLETLKAKGFKMAIGSSSKNARLILEHIGLGDFFHAVADGNCITRSKPDPEVFLKAAQMLDLSPEECLVIEDAQAGIQAAHDGGFRSAALGDAHQSPLATYRLSKFSDLLEYTAVH